MTQIKEVLSGNSGYSFFFTCIGKKYQNIFKNITLPFYKKYCKKYDIGIITINTFIDKNYYKNNLYVRDPGYQRLLAPSLIQKKFPKYKIICDIDTDCIPGFFARNIFEKLKKIKKNEIYLTKPVPLSFSQKNLGKRISLLRKLYISNKFPLDSVIIASNSERSKMFGYDNIGTSPTIGTCLASTSTLAKTGRKFYRDILLHQKFEYLQDYRFNYYKKNFKIKWLPYEFQAGWNYEMCIYYPFLYIKKFRKYFFECIISTLHRVDFLHFAGSWPENSYFKKLKINKTSFISKYYNNIPKYLQKNVRAKSYGRIKFDNKFKI